MLATEQFLSCQELGMHNLGGISIPLFPNIWVKVCGNLKQINLRSRSIRECGIQLKLSLRKRIITLFVYKVGINVKKDDL